MEPIGFQARSTAGVWDSVVLGDDGRLAIFRGLDPSAGDQLPLADPSQPGFTTIATGASIESVRAEPDESPSFAISLVTKNGTIVPLSSAVGEQNRTATGKLASIDPSVFSSGDAYRADMTMTGTSTFRTVSALGTSAPTALPALPPQLAQPALKLGQSGELAFSFTPVDGATSWSFTLDASDRSIAIQASKARVGTRTEIELPDLRLTDGWDEMSWGWSNILGGTRKVTAAGGDATTSWITSSQI
jgi:hypothetical protein